MKQFFKALFCWWLRLTMPRVQKITIELKDKALLNRIYQSSLGRLLYVGKDVFIMVDHPSKGVKKGKIYSRKMGETIEFNKN